MTYLWGAIIGLIYGLGVAVAKYILLWRKFVQPEAFKALKENQIIIRMIISFVTNVVTLLLVFFLRNVLPWDFFAVAIATALGLSGGGKLFSLNKKIAEINLEADKEMAREAEAKAFEEAAAAAAGGVDEKC